MKEILLISALTIGALSLQGCASGSGNYGYQQQQQSYNGPNLSQIGAALLAPTRTGSFGESLSNVASGNTRGYAPVTCTTQNRGYMSYTDCF
jgi:hypothetical protein